MDVLVDIDTQELVNRWNAPQGRVRIPKTVGDVVFVKDTPRPIDIGPDHFLAEPTVVDVPLDDNHKRGPEEVAVDVVEKTVTITNTTIPKDHVDLVRDWQKEMLQLDVVMPRHFEDHIEHVHGGVTDNPFQQTAYDNKKIVRGRKP